MPAVEKANWTVPGLNNYRQNVQPQGEFSAPDVTAAIFPLCDVMPYALVARVRNIGQAAVPAGVAVGFYAGDPDMGGVLLGSGMTKKSLYPAGHPCPARWPPRGLYDLFGGVTPPTERNRIEPQFFANFVGPS